MPADAPLATITIAGGGFAGWLAASLLARALPDLAISLVEVPGPDRSLGVAAAADVLLPDDLPLLGEAGWNGPDLLRGGRAGFVLGTALSGWRADGATAFMPYGEIGAPLGPIPFHQLVSTMRRRGQPVNMANYALGALAAQAGRFAPPPPGDETVHAALTFGLSIDTARLAEMLRGDALERGVRLAGTWHGEAVQRGDGGVQRLVLADGTSLAADLVIDASGPASPLSGARDDWSPWFPFDRVASARRTSEAPAPPYVHCDAHHAGWQSFAPLADGVGELFVFSSADAPGAPAAEPFAPGCQQAAWTGNVVRIGGAAAQHDPVAGLQLHLALADVLRLIALFPAACEHPAEAAEYNRQWREKTECAFDTALLRLACSGALGAVWDRLRARALPDRAAYRRDLYAANGRVVLHDGEVLEEAGWTALFDALCVQPRKGDALSDALPSAKITAHFAAIRQAMIAAVGRMPPYQALMAQVAA
ncbi:tryptophan 7-halogenase [Novosphingobium sp.]|uniref:tryptophan 7-halogenase n=1 Tax=Novosphingobium sp. TaxID=1874826 RepID=UPI002625B979|nr:tryptophan 7-halogenase [Novosphingobium sp.]